MIAGLRASDIRRIFADEVATLGGAVSDAFEDGPLLLARSVLPGVEEVRPGDGVQGGVAIRVDDEDVFVHPYVFRQVCTNGCIVATAIDTRRVELGDSPTLEDAEEAIREAIGACADPGVFAEVAGRMRSAAEMQADLVLNLMPLLRHLPGTQGAQVIQEIVRRFVGDGDRSRFGLVNAVTSTARDTPDAATRWRLEEFGGELLVGAPRAPRTREAAALCTIA